MRNLLFLFVLMAVSLVAFGGDLWHPGADGVAIAGPGDTTAQVCYWHEGTGPAIAPNPRPSGSAFYCDEEIQLQGAETPVYRLLPFRGPVRVIGAKWGDAEVDGAYVAMAAYLPGCIVEPTQ